VNALDRFLLFLLALAGVVTGIGLIWFGVEVSGGSAPDWLVAWFTPDAALYWIVAGVVLTLIALRFLFYRLRAPESDHVTLSGEHGQIRISYETVRQLAIRAGRGIRGVHDFDARVRMGQAGLLLYVRVRAHPDVELAQMSSEIQAAVKSYVERTAGVAVERVVVHVAEIAGSAPRSARAWVE
jgi:uncharacterized alkaline shock family protein YloU